MVCGFHIILGGGFSVTNIERGLEIEHKADYFNVRTCQINVSQGHYLADFGIKPGFCDLHGCV